MPQFRGLAKYFITSSEKLVSSLMFGLQPRVSLDAMYNDLADEQPGFSFLKHPANSLEACYLDLVHEAFTHPRDRLALNGHWCRTAVAAYEKQGLALEEMLYGGLHTACAQAPRAEELRIIGRHNGPLGARGIYIWQGSLIYLTRHYKSKRLMGHDFHVARFLPARLGQAVFLYLVYILPFLKLLRRQQIATTNAGITYPYIPENLLFGQLGKEYNTARLSTILRRATQLVWGHAVGVAVYRQLSIGVAERHVS